MSRNIFSAVILSLFLCIAILQPQTQACHDQEYDEGIAIEIGERSRAGLFREDEFILITDNGHGSMPSCINDTCIKRPNFDANVASDLFKQLKSTAETFLNRTVTDTVISVPAYFNDTQRQSIKNAAERVGLSVLRTVNEPTAACIAYRVDEGADESNYLVYNLNSRTVDVTVETVNRGVYEIMSIRSDNIGSDDLYRAFDALNTGVQAQDVLDSNHLTREKAAYSEVFNQTIPVIERVLNEAKVQKSQLDGIIITGTYVTKIQPFIEAYLGKKIRDGIPTDEIILRGIAKQAQVLTSDWGVEWVGMLDISVMSLGIDVGGIFRTVVSRNAIIPTRKTITITTIEDDQELIRVQIVQGARPLTEKNRVLGVLEIPVPPAPAGVPQIHVSFDVDANGITTVSAGEKGRQEVKLSLGNTVFEWTQEELDRVLTEAEVNHEGDELEKGEIQKEDRELFAVVEVEKIYEMKEESWFGWIQNLW